MSLAEKYNISLDTLNFEYIAEIKNAKELEKIIKILRSREEGYFPQLLEVAEQRLSVIHPRSLLLRFDKCVTQLASMEAETRVSLQHDLQTWRQQVGLLEQELSSQQSGAVCTQFPSVRGGLENAADNATSQKNVEEEKNKTESTPKIQEINENTEMRIKSWDYAAWDKFDVDKELINVEVQEDKTKSKEILSAAAQSILQDTNKILETDGLSMCERKVLAGTERARGNECYRAGELKQAVQHYTTSIQLYCSTEALNNRALANLKLLQLDLCLTDCGMVLQQEPGNIKALMRSGAAYMQQKDFTAACHTYSQILLIEPDNKLAQNELARAQGNILHASTTSEAKPKRLMIEEIGCNTEHDGHKQNNLATPTKPYVRLMDEDHNLVEQTIKNNAAEVAQLASRTTANKEGEFITSKIESSPTGLNAHTQIVVDSSAAASCLQSSSLDCGHLATQNESDSAASCLQSSSLDCGQLTTQNESNSAASCLQSSSLDCGHLTAQNESDSAASCLQSSSLDCGHLTAQNESDSAASCLQSSSLDCGHLTTQNESDSAASCLLSSSLDCDHLATQIKEGDCAAVVTPTNEQQIECDSLKFCHAATDNIEMPVRKISSPYQFLQEWHNMDKHDYQGYANLLKSFDPTNLSTVLGAELDSSMLSTLLTCIKEHMLYQDQSRAGQLLCQLTQVSRFSIMAAFMTQHDKSTAAIIIETLSSTDNSCPQHVGKAFGL